MFSFMNSMTEDAYGHISPLEMEQLPPTTRIVDVRERHEFDGELGHIPRAELVPLGTVVSEAVSWNVNDAIVVVCRSGGRSAQAAGQLARLGFKRIRNLDGGMLAYVRLGLPVERTS